MEQFDQFCDDLAENLNVWLAHKQLEATIAERLGPEEAQSVFNDVRHVAAAMHAAMAEPQEDDDPVRPARGVITAMAVGLTAWALIVVMAAAIVKCWG